MATPAPEPSRQTILPLTVTVQPGGAGEIYAASLLAVSRIPPHDITHYAIAFVAPDLGAATEHARAEARRLYPSPAYVSWHVALTQVVFTDEQ